MNISHITNPYYIILIVRSQFKYLMWIILKSKILSREQHDDHSCLPGRIPAVKLNPIPGDLQNVLALSAFSCSVAL